MNMATQQHDAVSEQLKQTTCPYCGVGCGVDISCNVSKRTITLDNVIGTPEHPANYGRLCVKGTNLLETNDLSGRLLHPTVAGKSVDWDTATDVIADKITSTIAQYGADAVAFYVSGQLLTEDYYVANKLMKGFIGSANIDTNSRLCMSSAVAAYKRAFGEDVVPCDYTDLENTDLIVITGSNAAWAHPVLFQRIERAKRQNPDMKVVVIDPRQTETCTIADMHLAIAPGTDVALFNGLLAYGESTGRIDHNAVKAFAEGLDDVLLSVNDRTIENTARLCDVDVSLLSAFYALFSTQKRVVTFYSMGINQSSSGVDKAQSIINCHLAFDLISKTGCGPFSITGQPNAMGGREVGGLANMLAVHCDIENPEHVDAIKTYWNAPVMPQKQGLKAVDLFNTIEQGKVKFVWIMGTNPVVSMPNRRQVERALTQCEMVVVSDIVNANDTLQFAHVALPATGWSEKDGTVTNSERRISRQRGILPAPGDAKHDWQIMCDVARKMGFTEAFDYTHPSQIFSEYAGLTGFRNNGKRQLDLSPLHGLSESQYNNLSPIQWPFEKRDPSYDGELTVNLHARRPFADKVFSTPSGKAKLIAVQYRAPLQQTSDAYPFIVNSGRARDHWHTMTRTGKAAKLHAHMKHASVHVHPDDATKYSLKHGQLVSLESPAMAKGSAKTPQDALNAQPVIYPVKMDDSIRRGEVFIPIHWSAQWGSHCHLGALYASAVDPISGQPELKHAAAMIKPAPFDVIGHVFFDNSIDEQALQATCHYWRKTPLETDKCASGTAYDIACNASRREMLANFMDALPKSLQVIHCHHKTHTVCIATNNSAVCFIAVLEDNVNDIIDASMSVLNGEGLTALANQVLGDAIDLQTQQQLLRGHVDERFMQGELVCSCFAVREKSIVEAVHQGAVTVSALGEALKCGTNCGSCKPALSQLISRNLVIATQSQ
ncbi:nitrate reductase [Alteromonas sp. 009811495]|uniref:nitrate reductase n=1 Tax=Alteromonas sp. 009811495 TaxID=3002962 RepID=UPI00237E236F|nr:nitrate reductase [Alteromonas sp. 009811495]WDT86743.1 molybdopterin-dependent oxidoreductase [Alteromonas sp. 009811495]